MEKENNIKEINDIINQLKIGIKNNNFLYVFENYKQLKEKKCSLKIELKDNKEEEDEKEDENNDYIENENKEENNFENFSIFQ
jgi:hypothetical protein